MPDVISFFGKAAALLQVLIATGVYTSPSGIVISTLLTDVTNVAKGAQAPSTQLVGSVEQLLVDLKANNILTGSAVDFVEADLTKFKTFATAIQSTPIGQPGIGPREKLLGVPGAWVYIPDTAEATVKDPLGL